MVVQGIYPPKSLWWMLDVKQLWRHLSVENCRVIKADKTGEVRFRNKKFVVLLTISNIQQEVKTIVILLYYVVYFVNINIVFYSFISLGYTEDNFPSTREPERVNIMDFSEISKYH